MEIFSEIKNNSIRTIIKAINDNQLKYIPIHKRALVDSLRGDLMPDASAAEEILLDKIFKVSEKDIQLLEPLLDVPFPIIPTAIENQWLAELLYDDRTNGLISIDLKDKLKASLPNKSCVEDIWTQINWNNIELPKHSYYTNPRYIETFRTCYRSLLEQRQVYYESYDEHGTIYKGTASPFKLEFCLNTNSFNFIMWNEEKNWTFKSDVATITNIKILDLSIPSDMNEKATQYVEQQKAQSEPIVIELTNKNDALNRCFMLLSNYDKKIYRIKNNIFKLEIAHRGHFDEEELTQIILSLGSCVTVLKPLSYREKIIEYIKTSFSR